MNEQERKQLLLLARETIVAAVNRQPLPQIDNPAPAFLVQSGCFVTIKYQGRLRGCIGNFVSERPLWETVREMAVSAATRDSRFSPMQPAELSDFDLEISVLSPLRDVGSVDEIQVGQHGLYIIKGSSHGVLLPQVATEYGWDRDTFLCQTCRKAGLPENSWQQPGCRILSFSAEVFGE